MMSEDKILSTESENMDRNKDIQTEIDQIMNDKQWSILEQISSRS